MMFAMFAYSGWNATAYIGEEATAVKTPGYPIIPLFFLMASLALMVIAFVNRPIESISAIITIIIGVPLFYFWKKRFSRSDE